MRRGTHILLTTGDDNIRIAALDRLCGKMSSLQAAATNLANRHSRHRVRQAGPDQGLPRGVLADTGSERLAHDHFGNLIRLHTGGSEQRFDDLGTQIGRRYLRDGTIEFTYGGT